MAKIISWVRERKNGWKSREKRLNESRTNGEKRNNKVQKMCARPQCSFISKITVSRSHIYSMHGENVWLTSLRMWSAIRCHRRRNSEQSSCKPIQIEWTMCVFGWTWIGIFNGAKCVDKSCSNNNNDDGNGDKKNVNTNTADAQQCHT